jgi:hypothetical protein
MKKSILSLVLIFCLNAVAQKNYETYTSHLSSQPFEIKIEVKNEKQYYVYIDMYSFDKSSEKGGIYLDAKQIYSFLENLSKAKEKYVEWVQISKENNLKQASKEMTFKFNSGAYFKYGGWNFQFNKPCSFSYNLIGENHYLMINTNKIYSSSNRYITHDGFVIAFKSPEEIDAFINLFAEEKLKEFVSKPQEKDLFKD